MLDLASDLHDTCRLMGHSRHQFYKIRRSFQTFGPDALIDRTPGARPNRVPAEIEAAILDHTLAHPYQGSTRVEQELRLKGRSGVIWWRARRMAASRPSHKA